MLRHFNILSKRFRSLSFQPQLTFCQRQNLRDVHQTRKYSRFSASTIMSGHDFFTLDSYDCIGFNLDNTVCHFNIEELMKLEYDILSRFLIDSKHYNAKYLLEPLEMNADFLQRGLIMDFERGNVIRTSADGTILKASHGNKLLSDEILHDQYGLDKKWDVLERYVIDPVQIWNTDLNSKMRACLDFFDIPAALCFANCVDAVDATFGPQIVYKIWPDILEGLQNMFNRENFATNKGGFYSKLKANPEKYYSKCNDSVLKWLKEIKQKKKTFLITGSNVDFAQFSATNSIGENWMDYFDMVVFYAKKPEFFTANNPFLRIKDSEETNDILKINRFIKTHVYSQGNWDEMYDLISHMTEKESPKTLYFGDNLIQDIYAASEFGNCDTIALLEEVSAEGMIGNFKKDPNSPILTSRMWGSLFCVTDRNGQDIPTLWSELIKRHCKLCIPSLNVMASQPLNYKYKTFTQDGTSSGFYPSDPINFVF